MERHSGVQRWGSQNIDNNECSLSTRSSATASHVLTVDLPTNPGGEENCGSHFTDKDSGSETGSNLSQFTQQGNDAARVKTQVMISRSFSQKMVPSLLPFPSPPCPCVSSRASPSQSPECPATQGHLPRPAQLRGTLWLHAGGFSPWRIPGCWALGVLVSSTDPPHAMYPSTAAPGEPDMSGV